MGRALAARPKSGPAWATLCCGPEERTHCCRGFRQPVSPGPGQRSSVRCLGVGARPGWATWWAWPAAGSALPTWQPKQGEEAGPDTGRDQCRRGLQGERLGQGWRAVRGTGRSRCGGKRGAARLGPTPSLAPCSFLWRGGLGSGWGCRTPVPQRALRKSPPRSWARLPAPRPAPTLRQLHPSPRRFQGRGPEAGMDAARLKLADLSCREGGWVARLSLAALAGIPRPRAQPGEHLSPGAGDSGPWVVSPMGAAAARPSVC